MATCLALALALIPAADRPDDEAVRRERERLQGAWKVVACDSNGRPAPARDWPCNRITFEKDKVIFRDLGCVGEGPFKVDPRSEPHACEFWINRSEGIDWPWFWRKYVAYSADSGWRGVYRLEGDRLTVCMTFCNDFTSNPYRVRLTLKRSDRSSLVGLLLGR